MPKNKNKIRDTEKEQADENDKIYEMLHHLREIDIVHPVTIKKDAFFFLTTTVFGVDTTFDLCNLWATDTCCHNKRMVNLETGNNLMFLGPNLFHFTMNDKTFSRIARELLDTEREQINLETIGADIEEDIAIPISKTNSKY